MQDEPPPAIPELQDGRAYRLGYTHDAFTNQIEESLATSAPSIDVGGDWLRLRLSGCLRLALPLLYPPRLLAGCLDVSSQTIMSQSLRDFRF